MTRSRAKQGNLLQGSGAGTGARLIGDWPVDRSQIDPRVVVIDHGKVIVGCDRRRHAVAFILGRRQPAAIYKRMMSTMEVAREIGTHWPEDEEFPVIQTERL